MIQGRRVAGVPNRLFLLAAASLLAVAGVGASGCSGERNATPGAGASASGSAESSPSSADASRGGAAGTSVPARSDHAPGTVASGADASLSIVTYRVRTMGTMGDIKVAVADSAAGWSFAHAGKRAWDRVDSLMSNWTETSEVARINRDGAAGVIVQPEVAQVIDRALSIGRESGGAFDITVEPLVRLWGFLAGTPHVPSNEQIEAMRQRVGLAQVDFTPSTRGLRFAGPGVHIDLGGIAKGYGVDAAVLDMAAAGARIMMIDLSGNIRTVGLPPGRDHWTIGVRDPKKRWPYFAQLDVDETALATSGNYEQFVDEDGKSYGHILDPRTGWPADGTLSVTVLTSSAMDADGWATALYVMGPDLAKQTLSKRQDLQGIVIAPAPGGAGSTRDVVWIESSLLERFRVIPEAQDSFEIRGF